MYQFRIFLASPGDVPLERKLAREAITHIGSERRFRDKLDIEVIAWDQPGAEVAMEAGLTPQQAIAEGLPKPEDCDLAVVILWSRIGTQLPAAFELKEDGTAYLSGTEWECLNALKGFKRNGKPAVWVYRREGIPNPPLDDSDYEVIVDQWKKLKEFFAAFNNPDGSLSGGINHYKAPDGFRQQFEHHLRDRLDRVLESLPGNEASPELDEHGKAAPRWTKSPYPGLDAFTPKQAPIFFGRGAEIDQLLQQLSDNKVRFVAVVGVSGSGKSSLVRAGLLPRLRNGIIGHAPWTDLIIKPGERGDNPFQALAFALKDTQRLSGQTERELTRAIQADGVELKKHLAAMLDQQPQGSELLLVIDQFEELFTLSSDADRKDFLTMLETIVAQPRVRIIATMRADFYARAIEEPILAGLLRQGRGTFPLDPPGVGALLQMIVRPAEAAGLELQEELPQRLLDDAGQGPGAMALIAFTLNQLYQREGHTNCLSIKAYEDFGGVKGAVQSRATAALNGLAIDPDRALPELFARLVEVNEREVATRSRVFQSKLEGEVKIAAEALTEAHLLVTGKGENNQPTLEVAHETVLTGWQKLNDWIVEHAETLRARRDLERVADEWEKAGNLGSALRTGKLLQRYISAAKPRSPKAEDYLTACKRRRSLLRVGNTILVLLFFVSLGFLFHVNKSHYPPILAAKALLVQWDVWPVMLPEMVTIPDGKFEMGDINGNLNEQHVRTVIFQKAFQIGKYEVTFEEYDLFAAATGRNKPADRGWAYGDNKRRGRLPVINVSWDDAIAYAEWLSARTELKYRLPSEAEWEYAARAGTNTPRHWPETDERINEQACKYANVFDNKNKLRILESYNVSWRSFDCEDDYTFTAPVGEFSANQWGVHDMLGNVWEWTQDCYVDSYYGMPTDGTSVESFNGNDCKKRVLRGGSWNLDPDNVRSAVRRGYTPGNRLHGIGFRLARTL